MRLDETKLYTSSKEYFEGPDGMKNEVTMWFVAGGLFMQELSIKNNRMPFGGLGGEIPEKPKVIMKLLDVCSGPGNFINHLQYIYSDLEVTCVDLNNHFIEEGQKIFKKWKFICGDVSKIDLKQKFDVVTASSAFHHIPDEYKKDFWNNINLHLEDNGFVLVCENFLPKYSNYVERQASIEKYYTELKQFYIEGNSTKKAFELIDEVYQLEKNGVEEHKVSFEIFINQIDTAGFLLFQDIIVWQPDSLKKDNAGSHVIILKKKI